MADPVLALDDQFGLFEAGVYVALGHVEVRELLRRQQRVEDGLERLRAQRDAALGLAQGFAVRRGQ